MRKARLAAMFVCCTLVAVAGVHVYWAFGGRIGLLGAIPVNRGGAAMIPIRSVGTLLVAGFLLGMSAIVALQAGWIPSTKSVMNRVATWMVALIFLVRSIGDFHYAGMFKTVRGTTFAFRDTWFFTPLCLLLAAATAFVAWSGDSESNP